MDPDIPRRTEIRNHLEVVVTLFSLDTMGSYEVTTTRNVSLHGACVLTKHQWPPNQRINVQSLEGSFSSPARVVHCRRAEEGSFAMGLEFFSANGEWKQEHKPPERFAANS
jgi:PilZ domain